MPVDLENEQPIAWDSPDLDADTRAMLDNLQPNILQAHVRDHMSILFVRFDDAADGRRFLRSLVPLMKSARQHLAEVRRHRRSNASGTVYVGVGISKDGYRRLGFDPKRFGDVEFNVGMKRSRDLLGDPPVDEWEEHYQGELHAVVLIGDATPEPVEATRAKVLGLLGSTVRVVGEETGLGMRNPAGKGIEHFGYVDGRSQPLFLADQVAEERSVNWEPFFPLKHVLAADALAPDPDRHFGSYLVFRKLEQNVRAFRQAEEDLADALGLTGADRARAGAMLVGRFRDGTPLRLHGKPGADGWPTQNDFNYAKDPGTMCPAFAHVRKMSPREARDSGSEHFHDVMMPRRGQTYGTRTDDPWDDAPPETRPTGGVGLLFMAFNGTLGQFLTIQNWANTSDFPQDDTGHDPIIGQGKRTTKVRYPETWGGPKLSPPQPQAPQTVTMKGGEFFFMPSLAYLKSL